jgi:3-deoxy-D-manno-octulosonate 8-phosphate phosphatase (KDO 8-P phosphatase)
MHTPITKELNEKLAKVKMLLCDVDGILTDASVFIGLEKEIKRFHIRDGLGMMMLRKEGVLVGWVSARPSTATTLRAEELKIDFLVQDKTNKVQKVEGLLAETGLKWDQICYMGDDIVDLGVLRRAGVAVTVADAIAEAKAAAHYITQAEGGHGAVREVIDLILKAQNRWDRLVAEHSA